MSCIIEQIAVELLTTLGGVTTGAGYGQTLSVSRPKKKPFEPLNNKALLYQTGWTKDEENAPAGRYQWWAHFSLEVYCMPNDTDTTAIDTYLNSIAADVAKALRVDYQRSNKAIDTIIEEPSFFVHVNSGFDGAMCNFSVRYRTLQDDPFSA